jgi:hypothetical protein
VRIDTKDYSVPTAHAHHPVTAIGNIRKVGLPNPLKGGMPLRFANMTQDADAPTWLSLGVVRLQ